MKGVFDVYLTCFWGSKDNGQHRHKIDIKISVPFSIGRYKEWTDLHRHGEAKNRKIMKTIPKR